MSVTAYIGLGSNLGERRAYLEKALQTLREQRGIVVSRVSMFYDTAPVGGPAGQGRYLNAVAELMTDLAPAELLQTLLAVEQGLGRVRREKDGPRTIDLDILLYGDATVTCAEVTIPHPRLHERRFVLEPLSEIAPDVVHPTLKKTSRELLAELHQPQADGLHPVGQADAPRELQGQRALVTGSTSGIGRAIALELARAGAQVIVHGRRAAAAEEVASQVRSLSVQASHLLADLHQAEECSQLVQDAWREWDGIDIWINNAGADTLTGAAGHWPFERKLAELLAVDVTASMLLSRAVGARMKSYGSGVILNMGWDQAEIGMKGDSGQLFAATKGAVMAFSKSLAVSLAPEVRVNCLAPGWIRTAWGDSASTVWHERVRRDTLLGRWGTAEDVAAAARWLVGPAARFITGQVIRINGGAVR